MKCKKCLVEYQTKEIRCPNCGAINFKEWMKASKQEPDNFSYDQVSMENGSLLRLWLTNHTLKRLLQVEIGLMLFVFLCVVAVFFLPELFTKMGNNLQSINVQGHMEKLYTEGQYHELDCYINENNLRGQDYEYDQIVRIQYFYDSFQMARMKYFQENKAYEQNDAESLIRDMNKLLAADQNASINLTTRNKPVWQTYCQDAQMFATAILGFDETQMETLKVRTLFGDDEDQLIEAVMHGREHNGR